MMVGINYALASRKHVTLFFILYGKYKYIRRKVVKMPGNFSFLKVTVRAGLFVLIWAGTALSQSSGNDAPARHYAPDRKVDIRHIVIDVTPDFEARTIAGVTTITFAPIAEELTELRLDAIDLDVLSVTSSAKIDDYSVTDEDITITFDPAVPPAAETQVTVKYEAEPKQGLYFRTPQMGYRAKDMHLFSQGESHQGPHWYPNYDYPNERFTSEVICRVPREMTVLSNGKLISEKIDPKTRLKAVRWRQDQPHVNYLIALTAGFFDKIEARYKDIPLAFYTPASKIELAENSFKNTAAIMGFFEREIGVAYPWDKYYQVVVEDFVAGGMENTSLTILTDRTLFTEDFENLRSSQSLVAHEMAHQWFGDYVTCKDWSHLWLNEGFATYYQKLSDGYLNGRDSMLYQLHRIARGVLADRSRHKPMVHKAYRSAGEQFDYRAYSKGAWVLHMLRGQLGEDLYRRCVKTFLERHAFSTAVTEDFNAIIEELSGRSFDRFFDQWVYHARHPDLTVNYSWSQKDKLAKVSVRQTHEINDEVMLFHFNTRVRFITENGVVDRDITVNSKEHDFYFPLSGEPNIVRFDPEFTLLADVKFHKPAAMLHAQVENQADVIGRLLALDKLKDKKDKKTIAKLKHVLNHDSFYGVRQSASSALREIHTDEAFEALAESLDQQDARVREQVVGDLGDFYRSGSLEITKRILKTEKNPDIVSSAIRNLGRYHQPDTRDLLVGYLGSSSYRNILAQAAIDAIRMLDDSYFIKPLREVLSRRETELTSRDFAEGLDTLGHLSRNDKEKTEIHDFLTDYVNHPRQQIQIGAINALGSLGDPRAKAIVETFADDEPTNRLERAAREALKKLREQKPVAPDEIISLRETIDKLKQEHDNLKDELEDLKKRIEADKEGQDNRDQSKSPETE
jgi:aminopeptidase N